MKHGHSTFSRELAERSPYLEALREKQVEVLFCFEPYDEMVLLQLRQFDGKPLTSVEKEMRQMKDDLDLNALRKLLAAKVICLRLYTRCNRKSELKLHLYRQPLEV